MPLSEEEKRRIREEELRRIRAEEERKRLERLAKKQASSTQDEKADEKARRLEEENLRKAIREEELRRLGYVLINDEWCHPDEVQRKMEELEAEKQRKAELEARAKARRVEREFENFRDKLRELRPFIDFSCKVMKISGVLFILGLLTAYFISYFLEAMKPLAFLGLLSLAVGTVGLIMSGHILYDAEKKIVALSHVIIDGERHVFEEGEKPEFLRLLMRKLVFHLNPELARLVEEPKKNE